ncbi:vesicle-fusing ATPase 1-like protein [Leptotrombidium deliense]|uniref:Vesicle-fusing ATPase n=1 Tax=Leptotrombidium deliense TaxID=299467 RepID=A0A443RXZ1_9ACAR|nr:vesicle-fusing ATPase 1-like protein [Leptotrombidium deliense]
MNVEKKLKIVRSPSLELSFTNCVIFNHSEFDKNIEFVNVEHKENKNYVFKCIFSDEVKFGEIGYNLPMRKWTECELDETVIVKPLKSKQLKNISTIKFDVGYLLQNRKYCEKFNEVDLSKQVLYCFNRHPFRVSQTIGMEFIKNKPLLKLTVRKIEFCDSVGARDFNKHVGIIDKNTKVQLQSTEQNCLKLYVDSD